MDKRDINNNVTPEYRLLPPRLHPIEIFAKYIGRLLSSENAGGGPFLDKQLDKE